MDEIIINLLQEELNSYTDVYGEESIKKHINIIFKLSNISLSKELLEIRPELIKKEDEKRIVFKNDKETFIINGYISSDVCQVSLEFKNDKRITKTAFKMIDGEFLGYSIANIEHQSNEDYMLYIRERDNLYLDSISERPLIGTIYHFPINNKNKEIDTFTLYSTKDKIDFILSDKYHIESLSKIIRYFQEDSKIVMDTLKEENIGRIIQFISFNSSYDFIYSDDVCHLNLSKVPHLDEALRRGGKVYEFTKKDEEYFKQLGNFDMEEFTIWRKMKEDKKMIKK